MPRYTTVEKQKMGLGSSGSPSPLPTAYWETPSQAPKGYVNANPQPVQQKAAPKSVATKTGEWLDSTFKPKAQTNFTPRMGLPNPIDQGYPNRRDFIVGAVGSFEGAFYGIGGLITAVPTMIAEKKLTFGHGWEMLGLQTPDMEPTMIGAGASSVITGVQGKGWSPEAQAIGKKSLAYQAGSIAGEVIQFVAGGTALTKVTNVIRGGKALKIASATEKQSVFATDAGAQVGKRTTNLIVTSERVPLKTAKAMKEYYRYVKPDKVELAGTEAKLTKVVEKGGSGSQVTKFSAGQFEDIRNAEPLVNAAKAVKPPKNAVIRGTSKFIGDRSSKSSSAFLKSMEKNLGSAATKVSKMKAPKVSSKDLESTRFLNLGAKETGLGLPKAKYYGTASVTERTAVKLSTEEALSQGAKTSMETGFERFNTLSKADRVLTGVRMTGKIDSQVYLKFMKNVSPDVAQNWLPQMGGVTKQQLIQMGKVGGGQETQIWTSMKAISFEVPSSKAAYFGSLLPQSSFISAKTKLSNSAAVMSPVDLEIRQKRDLKDYASSYAATMSEVKTGPVLSAEFIQDQPVTTSEETALAPSSVTYQDRTSIFPPFSTGGGDITIGGSDWQGVRKSYYYKRGRKKWKTTKPKDLLKILF